MHVTGSSSRPPRPAASPAPLQPGISGLWLFSREPQNPEALAEMQAVLEDWGVDASELVPVQQEGCSYA